MTPERSYAFGDSTLAARRLALLADVFGPTTARFVRRLAAGAPGLVVDLGCGPGFTTALLRDTLAPARLVAVERSDAFAREASVRLGTSAEVLRADVTDLPPELRDADVVFARFLATHLADPAGAIAHWLDRLGTAGSIALEEIESIDAAEPALATYLDLQRAMLRANDNRLEIGPAIERAARELGATVDSEVAMLTPPTAAAARMFAMNLASWRSRPAVAELATARELDEIAAALDAIADDDRDAASITWQLRQLTITPRRSPQAP